MYGQFPVRAIGQDRAIVHGSFTTHGTTPVIRSGEGFSVARAGAGRWTVTLDNPVPAKLVSIVATCFSETLTAPMLVFGDQDVTAAGSFELRTWDVVGGALADDAGSEVHFVVLASDVYTDA